MYGIDLSNNNGKLASVGSAQFVFAKCTQSTNFADPLYGHNAQLAHEARAQFGAYHYFIAGSGNARSQAEYFMRNARPRSFLSMWVDYEVYGIHGGYDATELGLFISTIKLAYPKQKVGIYANTTGLQRIQPYLAEIPYDAIWYANPSLPAGEQPSGLPTWQVHQYGVRGGVDQDYSFWSESQMQAFFAWT
jgi:GH25 family lysozyme M1 (1,4-beta-N-acetylmuramidase)